MRSDIRSFASDRNMAERERLKRGSLQTDSSKKRRKRERDAGYHKTRINIGEAGDRWKSVMGSIPSINTNEEFAVFLLDSYESNVKGSMFASTPQTGKKVHQRRVEPEDMELTEISTYSTETELSGVETLEPQSVPTTQLYIPQPGPSRAQQGFSRSRGGSGERKTDTESVYVDPFELTIFTSEEGDDTNSETDEDYQCTFDPEMSLRLSHPEAFSEVSFGDVEFSEGEGEEVPELEEEEEEEMKESVEVSGPTIIKITDSEKAETVLDDTFVVFRQCILELAKFACSQFCNIDQSCNKPVEVQQKVIGSALRLKWVCSNGHVCHQWSSQPVLNRKLHVGDLLISFAVLSSGNNFGKLTLFARALKLHFPGSTSFHNIQRTYLVPTIDQLWKEQQTSLLSHFAGKDVVLAGDGRMDSSGHSAQYCTYSLMEMDSSKILSIATVDKRETGKVSAVMEKLGFQKALQDLTTKNVKVSEIATDQHMQISALMKKEHPGIKHSFDVWHGAKNLGKKINAASQQKEAKDLQKWTSHITNHFWHACKEAEDEYDFRGIWLGVVNHVVDVHQWILSRGGDNRTKCSHGPLLETEEKKWLEKGSKAHETIQKIAYDKRFLNNIKYYLKFRSTASLESFNQLILMYAAKRYSYTPPVYKARCQLAAIDNNYHADRDVKINKDGSTRMHRFFNKKSKRWTVTAVKEEKDYGYLNDLAKRVVECRLECRRGMSSSVPLAEDDPRRLSKTIASKDPPPTKELVEERKTRL